MLRSWRRPAWAIVLVAVMMTSASASNGYNNNDAGSGADAPNARANALEVAQGPWHAAYLAKNDIDWYQTDASGPNAGCVLLSGYSYVSAYYAVAAETASGTVTAPLTAPLGELFTGGVAGAGDMTGTLRVRGLDNNKNGWYGFKLERIGVPTGSGDGPDGYDAGATAGEAMSVPPGCIGGHLTIFPQLDMRDVFRVEVDPGEAVTYSLAANAGGVTLSLVDAADALVGPVLQPGEVAAVAVPSGSYFLSAQRSNAVGDVGYVAGVVVGPDPTGCRPYCLA